MTGDRLSPVVSWRGVIAASDLSCHEKAVAWALANYMNARGESAFPSLELLSSDASCARSTVAAALKTLRQRGFLERVAGGGRGHRSSYTALIPETVRVPDGSSGGTGSAGSPGEARTDVLAATADSLLVTPRSEPETVRVPDGSGGAKPSAPRSQTVRGTDLNSPWSGPEVEREVVQEVAAAGARASAALAERLNGAAAAGELRDLLDRVGAGAQLVAAAWESPALALAWLRLAVDEANANPAGFVMAGIRTGEPPSPRGSLVSSTARQDWVEATSHLLDPELARDIVDGWELDDGEAAMWHQAVLERRERHEDEQQARSAA